MTMLEVFDQPPMSPNCIERRQSTVPTQALQMMNSDVVQERSRYLAGRLVDQFGNDREKQIQALYALQPGKRSSWPPVKSMP